MKEDTRKRLAKLILEELSDKIKGNEVLGRKLESFTDLPVEKVADAILKQFEYLLSSELRDLIVHLIEQEVASETAKAETVEQIETPPDNEKPVLDKSNVRTPEEFIAEETHSQKDVIQPVQFSTESVMEHFGVKEPFPTQPMDIPLSPDDWFYLIAFSYAPDSAGKGVPSTKLGLKGIDNRNEIFLLDYGDVRLYMNKLIADDFSRNKTGEPLLSTTAAAPFKFTHEKILNVLRTQEVLVPLPFWSVIQGHENIIKLIEDRYVELLRALIDVHDAMEMDVEVFASDVHIASLAEISGASKGRTTQRESRHPASKKIDVKLMEKVIMREKNLAQDIHSQLLVKAVRGKVDFMIRLDGAFLDDWKSILSARYTVGKEKRKAFCQTVEQLQDGLKEYELMVRVTSPSVRFTLQR